MHPSFKINNQSFTEESFKVYITELLNSEEKYLKEIGVFLQNWTSSVDYIIVNTSGSTGTPKEIKLLKKHMINSALATGKYFGLKENTTALLCLSANYIAGKMMLVRALVLGWHIHQKPVNSKPLEDGMMYDFAAMVPMQVINSLDKLNNIKQLIIGGAPVSPTLQHKLQSVNTQCFVTYGMTETCTHIAIKSLSSNAEDLYEVLSNVSISQDSRECLVISAPDISNEIITTNDIVKLKNQQQFQWLGRYDNVINSGGVKLFPEQIERKLAAVIKQRFFVIGIPDNTLGEQLILVIEQDSEVVFDNKLLSKILSKYEIPKKIYYHSKFIETSTGKVHRAKTLKAILEE